MGSSSQATVEKAGHDAAPRDFWVRWGLAKCADESRIHARMLAECQVRLVDLKGQNVVCCSVDNFSAGGLHALAPVGYGLGVGQRYEFHLEIPEGPLPNSVVEYGTVVRTELLLGEQEDQQGISVRFDNPLHLPEFSLQSAAGPHSH